MKAWTLHIATAREYEFISKFDELTIGKCIWCVKWLSNQTACTKNATLEEKLHLNQGEVHKEVCFQQMIIL